MPRDFQRKRVYDADAAIPYGKMLSFNGVCQMVERILRSRWWQKRCAIGMVEVSLAHGNTRVCCADRKSGTTGFFVLGPKDEQGDPRSEWSEGVVVHEMTHVLCKPSQDPDDSHGRYWAKAYYDITLKFMGKKIAKALIIEYLRNGVRCEPPPDISELF